jgi:hypothetical protein
MKHLHWILAGLGALLLLPAQAQKLDEAWHGRWSAPELKIEVSAKSFRVGQQNCRWVEVQPKRAFKGCVAYYGGAYTKAELMTLVKERGEAVNEFVKQKMYDAKTAAAERKSLAQTRAIIEQLGTDQVKPVVTQDAQYEGSGDCMSSFFLDQSRVFNLVHCAGGDGGFSIAELKKR